eukprot:350065-Chlamydomonas_euryale.AAC.3
MHALPSEQGLVSCCSCQPLMRPPPNANTLCPVQTPAHARSLSFAGPGTALTLRPSMPAPHPLSAQKKSHSLSFSVSSQSFRLTSTSRMVLRSEERNRIGPLCRQSAGGGTAAKEATWR